LKNCNEINDLRLVGIWGELHLEVLRCFDVLKHKRVLVDVSVGFEVPLLLLALPLTPILTNGSQVTV